MANQDENLVSQVQVTGTDESAAALEKYADRGSKAFEKLNKSAQQSAAGVEGAAAGVADATDQAGGSLDKLSQKKIDTGNATRLKEIQKAAFDLGTEVRKTIKDVSQFVTRVVALGAAATAAGAGVLKLASSVAKQAQGTSDALDKQTQSQVDANNAALAATQASINYESAQRKLFQQFQNGAIDFQTYSANLRQLQQDFAEQKRVQGELDAAQEATRLENERLQKTLADRKVYNDLIDTWGGPMLTALTALGGTVNTLFGQFKQAFGPAVSGLIDNINSVLSRNAGSIAGFFDAAAAKINEFVQKNGPEIEKALTSVGQILGSIFDGILAALPTLVSLFNNGIVPAVNAVGSALQGVANIWNALFGTQATAGVVAVTLALATMTGGVKALLGVLAIARTSIVLLTTLFGPWGLAIAAIVVALGLLATQIDWAKLVADTQNAIQQIIAFFQQLPDQISAIWTGIWDGVANLASAGVQLVIDAWNGLVAFFQTLIGTIGDIFNSVGAAITDAFNNAVNSVKQYLADLSVSAMGYLQPIIDALKTIIGLNSSADAGAGAPGFATGGSPWAGRTVRGPGTSTSDSVAAWLSNNEFVMQARAVRKYGAAFMHAINAGKLDPSNIARFAVGGLVGAFTQPRVSLAPVSVASGGSTAAARILNLTIGDQQFNGLQAPDDVADRLERFAVNRQARSAGRKPSWVGGTR